MAPMMARLLAALCLSALMGSASATDYFRKNNYYDSKCRGTRAEWKGTYEVWDMQYIKTGDIDTCEPHEDYYKGKFDCRIDPASEWGSSKIQMFYWTDPNCTVPHPKHGWQFVPDACQPEYSVNNTTVGWSETWCKTTFDRPVTTDYGVLALQYDMFSDANCTSSTGLKNELNKLREIEFDLGCKEQTEFKDGAFVYKSTHTEMSGSVVTMTHYTSRDCSSTTKDTTESVTCGVCHASGSGSRMVMCPPTTTTTTSLPGAGKSFGLSTTPSSYTFLAIATFLTASVLAA